MPWVYAIACRDLIKVGRTDGDPVKRLAQLQTGQPDQLELIHAWPCADSYTAERCMHLVLAQHHHRGEWFRATPDQVAKAWALVVKGKADWWYRVRWRWTRARRRARWAVAWSACWTGVATWVTVLGWALLHLG